MSYDHEKQKLLDKIHLLHPKAGDYWHEMYSPIARVLDATDDWVIVQKVSGMGGKEISDTDPKPCAMKLRAFKRWLSYETIPDSTWAHVVPNRFPPEASLVTRPNGGDGDPSCRDPNCTYGQDEAPAPLDTRAPRHLDGRGFRDDEPLVLDIAEGVRRVEEPKPE